MTILQWGMRQMRTLAALIVGLMSSQLLHAATAPVQWPISNFSVTFACQSKKPDFSQYVIEAVASNSKAETHAVRFRSNAYPQVYLYDDVVYAQVQDFRQNIPGDIQIGKIDLKSAVCGSAIPITLGNDIASLSIEWAGQSCGLEVPQWAKLNDLAIQLVDGERYSVQPNSCN